MSPLNYFTLATLIVLAPHMSWYVVVALVLWFLYGTVVYLYNDFQKWMRERGHGR